MDLPGLNSTSLSVDSALQQAGGARLQALASGARDDAESRENLVRSAKEFEGVFLNQLLKAMRSTVPENEFFNSSGPTKFYQQMYDAEMSQALADGETGMGIAGLIIQQFEKNVEAAGNGEKPTDPVPAPLPLQISPTAIGSYGTHAPLGPEGSRMIRLRRAAGQQEAAVADTLRRFEGPLVGAARQTDLDPALLLAVVMEESGGDPEARSRTGAQGLMQLMPATADELGVEHPFDPAQNVAGGARYLREMLDRYDGRRDLALAAYNAGPGNVDKAGGAVPDFPETQRYVERVEARYRELTGGTEMANYE